jgi:hypothetical protein
MPIAVMIGTAKRNIIVVPCIVKSWLYRSGPTSVFSGRISCVRITAASSPPAMNIRKAVTMYRLPIDLWSTDVTQPQNPGRARHVVSSSSIVSLTASGASV